MTNRLQNYRNAKNEAIATQAEATSSKDEALAELIDSPFVVNALAFARSPVRSKRFSVCPFARS
ncbi:MAG: hypothetical protein GDA38_09465 [Hormoscilla sp. SP12CHS1]|nr:hypothetical protein [Hormoscilla sp. SP12CHS1]